AEAEKGAAAAAQHRVRLPGLQAAPEAHRSRECRLRPEGSGRERQPDPPQGPGGTEPRRPRAQDELLSGRALGRRAAARLDRARRGQPPAAPDLRRADREPGPRHVGRDHAAALPDQPRRDDRADGDARPRDGRQDAPPRDRARRRPPCPRRARRRLRLVVARLKLLFSEAIRSLGANISTTFAATMTVLIGMFLLGFLIGLATWGFSVGNHYKRELVVRVFFDKEASMQKVNAVQTRLLADPRVKSVAKVTPGEALKKVENQYPSYKGAPLPSNPLGYTLTVQPKRGEDTPGIYNSLK